MRFSKNWPNKLIQISEKYIRILFFVCFCSLTIVPAMAQSQTEYESNSTKTINHPESAVSLTLNKGIIQTLVKRHNQKHISSYNLDFSGNTLATTGSFHDYKLSFDYQKFNFGLVYGEAKSRAQLNTVLQGSSSALFSDATLTSSSTIKSKSIGIFSKLEENGRARTHSSFTLRARVQHTKMTNDTFIKAGILSSESKISEKFKTYEVGYSQELMFDLSDHGQLAWNISRDSTVFKNNLSQKNYDFSVGYKIKFQKARQPTQLINLNQHKKALRFSILDGMATGFGTFKNNPDQYYGSSNYSAIIPIEPRGFTVSRVIKRDSYRQHSGFAYKRSKTSLSTLGLDNTFGANNFYAAEYSATVTRNLLVYAHEWGLTDTAFILAGVSAGVMKIDTEDQTVSKGLTSIKSQSTTVPIGSLILGVGTRYKINDNVNGFVETRMDYTDGKPFSVPHRLIEITTLVGLELGFRKDQFITEKLNSARQS